MRRTGCAAGLPSASSISVASTSRAMRRRVAPCAEPSTVRSEAMGVAACAACAAALALASVVSIVALLAQG